GMLAAASRQAATTYRPCTRQYHHQDEYQGDDDAQYVGLSHDLRAAAQPVDAIRRRDDVSDANAIFFVNHHHFALGDQVAVDKDIHGFTCQAVQFHDGTLAQLQDIAYRQPRAPQFHRELDGNVHDHIDVALRIAWRIHQGFEQPRSSRLGASLHGCGSRL